MFVVTHLRTIFTEASGMPLLLRAKQPAAGSSRPGGVDFEMVQLHDLQFLVQNFPMPETNMATKSNQ